MFIHSFKYTFKSLFRDRMLIFWTFAFPLILGTFFNLAFSNIESSESLDTINIAIAEKENSQAGDTLTEILTSMKDGIGEKTLFNVQNTDEAEAAGLLENKDICGYIVLSDDAPKLVISSNGINETILKFAVDEILQSEDMIKNVFSDIVQELPPERIAEEAEIISDKISEYIGSSADSIKNISGDNLSYTMIEYYTLIAMTCLYGGILGMTAVNRNLANMSPRGKRVSVCPVSKWRLILGNVLAGYTVQLIGIAILYLYSVFVIKVDFGSDLPLIVALTMLGCLAGLTMGIAVSVLIKSGENTKTGIIISVTMFGCFLSGMMGITMKYIVDSNLPLLSRINPANMITDGLYALYYYNTPERYILNIVSLAVFSALMIILSAAGLRRQKYDSI